VKYGKGVHSWLFSDPECNIILSGAGPDDGLKQLLTSYCSELGRLMVALGILSHIQKLQDLRERKFTI